MGANHKVAGVEPWGGRSKATVVDHIGPKSYTTGGETLGQNAMGGPNVLGLSGFSYVSNGITNSGTYRVETLYSYRGVRSTVLLKWTTISTNTEVSSAVDLSGETVRILAIGG